MRWCVLPPRSLLLCVLLVVTRGGGVALAHDGHNHGEARTWSDEELAELERKWGAEVG